VISTPAPRGQRFVVSHHSTPQTKWILLRVAARKSPRSFKQQHNTDPAILWLLLKRCPHLLLWNPLSFICSCSASLTASPPFPLIGPCSTNNRSTQGLHFFNNVSDSFLPGRWGGGVYHFLCLLTAFELKKLSTHLRAHIFGFQLTHILGISIVLFSIKLTFWLLVRLL